MIPQSRWTLILPTKPWATKLLDQIEVQGKAEGTFSGVINFVGGLDQVAADKMHSENWLITQKSGVMTATGTSAANGAMQSWALKFFNTDDQTKLPTTQEELDAASSTSDGNEGWWYLVRSSSKTPEENTNTNVGTSTGQALSWAAEIEDLRLALGRSPLREPRTVCGRRRALPRIRPKVSAVTASRSTPTPFMWVWIV